MRLKSIKLAGFKSFVDATTVPFPTNMTAIVGPNGCGKSNIIDAVRWVMGESSAKNLRGESMTDVIFNGSTGRQPVGQASIELLFDNSEGKLEGEHGAFAEISIKRKVTREGLSQYYLNGTKCRRRDVTDIFLGTGMGPRSYAIIEQGMIARLIESKPEELRVYLEEAAGISKYKERRRDTENRMRRTQENLDRLSDIRDELAKQLQHLKRQANAAEKFAEYKQAERWNTAKLHTVQWSELEQKRSALQRQVEGFEEQIERAVLDKSTHESRIEAARTELEERQEVFNRIQAKYYESGADIAKLEQQLKYQKEQLLRQDQELAQLQLDRQRLEERQSVDIERSETLQETLEALLPELEAQQEALDAAQAVQEEHETSLRAWQEQWEQFNQNTAQTRQNAEVQQSRMQQSESQITQLEARRQRLSAETDQIKAQLDEQVDQGAAEQQRQLEERLTGERQALEDRRQQLREWRAALDEKNRARSGLVNEAAEQRAVLASLKTLQSASLENESVQAQLQKQGLDLGAPWVSGVTVEAGWERAFEHVMQSWLKAFSGDEFESVMHAVDNQCAVTIIDAKPAASAHVSRDSMAQKVTGAEALSEILGRILVVESREEALNKRGGLEEGESIIARDGTWVGRYWMRIYAPEDQGAGVMERARKISELEQSLPELEERLHALDHDIAAQSEAVHQLESALSEAEKHVEHMSRELSQLQAQEKVKLAKEEQLELRIKRNQNELAEITLNLENETERLEMAREGWQEAMLALEGLVDERSAQQESRDRIQQLLEQARTEVQSRQTRFHQAQMQSQQTRSEWDQVKSNLARLAEDLKELEAKNKAAQSYERVDEQDLQDGELRLEGMLEARLQDEEKLAEARQAMEQVNGTLRNIEGERASKESRLQSLRAELEQARMSLQALQMRQTSLIESIEKDDFSLDEMKAAVTEEDSLEALEKTLEQLAARIQRLGPINLAAIDEFKEQNERKEYLDSQHEDLTEALDTLLSAIRKIDKETRARFKETYDQVNEGLQRLFPKIFGGGSAHLELTDDDLLETGVAIIARPPGKKNSTIHLLSGGEKALTAIALIFAIFELNPAPFCMLDEVDAPLDDANVGRFANMVKEMSAQVQFIYISHNKVSMEMADQLMGVTMHEPGVSRLVSVDVDEAAALAEA